MNKATDAVRRTYCGWSLQDCGFGSNSCHIKLIERKLVISRLRCCRTKMPSLHSDQVPRYVSEIPCAAQMRKTRLSLLTCSAISALRLTVAPAIWHVLASSDSTKSSVESIFFFRSKETFCCVLASAQHVVPCNPAGHSTSGLTRT